MARTVTTSSTFENWRQNYNDLATDVGDPTTLTTGTKDSVVNAINYIQDQYFFFQDFDYDGSDGASSNSQVRRDFSGVDNNGNTLQYMAQKVLVYKHTTNADGEAGARLLRNGTDYIALDGTNVILASSAAAGDTIRISSYTGSYTQTPAGQESIFHWQTAGSNVFNNNSAGLVIQSGKAPGALTTAPTVANSIQFEGDVYHNYPVTVGVDGTGHDVKFFGDTAGSYILWDQSADALLLTDSTPIKLGDSQDLEIYHDGSNSYVEDDGTGDLRLKGSTVRLQGTGGTNLLVGTTSGATSLYYRCHKCADTK